MRSISGLITVHRKQPDDTSRLKVLVPSIGNFFTELDLVTAYNIYDKVGHMSKRSFVPPSFNEIRSILNIAQVRAMAKRGVQLITFDGDQTLYADGRCITRTDIIGSIIDLMKAGTVVAVVTAASYLENASGYEQRLSNLLQAFRDHQLKKETLQLFYVVGGECNYFFQCNEAAHLEYIPRERWQTGVGSLSVVSCLVHNCKFDLNVYYLHCYLKTIATTGCRCVRTDRGGYQKDLGPCP